MASLYNLARMTVSGTPGAGTITLGSAVSGYLTFAQAGVTDGAIVSYGIKDGSNSEVGTGTYTSSGTTLTRTVTKSTNSNAAISATSSAEVFITVRAEDVREKLTGNRTYYVRTDGSNSNTGLVDSAGGAFLTGQKALDVIAMSLDLNSYDVTIQIKDGTFTGAWNIAPWTGGGNLTIQGNSSTPSNVLISVTSSDAFAVTKGALPGELTIKDLKIQTTTSGYHIKALTPSLVKYGNIDFGAAPSIHLNAQYGGRLQPISNYAISAAAAFHIYLGGGGALSTIGAAITVTVSGSPAFTTFCNVESGAVLYMVGSTFSGSATGKRYNADRNGLIQVGGGASFFPGGTAGTTANGGQYY